MASYAPSKGAPSKGCVYSREGFWTVAECKPFPELVLHVMLKRKPVYSFGGRCAKLFPEI